MPYSPFIMKLSFYIPGYQKPGVAITNQEKNSRHAEYIATRPGADYGDPEVGDPDYTPVKPEDWNPKREQATPDNQTSYIANRPRSFGLFGEDDLSPPDLKATQEELKNHQGIVWRAILSVREDDAIRIGYADRKAWEKMLRGTVEEAAGKMGIPETNLRWVAAMHQEAGHPHAHLMIWEKTPKKERGKLDEKTMQSVRRIFVREIFRDERTRLETQKTVLRNTLKDLGRTTITEAFQMARDIREYDLEFQAQNGSPPGIPPRLSQDNEETLESRLRKLADIMPGEGSAKRRFVSREIKAEVDDLADWLLSQPGFKVKVDEHLNATEELTRYHSIAEEKIRQARQNAYDDLKKRVIRDLLKAAADLNGSRTPVPDPKEPDIQPPDPIPGHQAETYDPDDHQETDSTETTRLVLHHRRHQVALTHLTQSIAFTFEPEPPPIPPETQTEISEYQKERLKEIQEEYNWTAYQIALATKLLGKEQADQEAILLQWLDSTALAAEDLGIKSPDDEAIARILKSVNRPPKPKLPEDHAILKELAQNLPDDITAQIERTISPVGTLSDDLLTRAAETNLTTQHLEALHALVHGTAAPSGDGDTAPGGAPKSARADTLPPNKTALLMAAALRQLGISELHRDQLVREWNQRTGRRLSDDQIAKALHRVSNTTDPKPLRRKDWRQLLKSLGHDPKQYPQIPPPYADKPLIADEALQQEIISSIQGAPPKPPKLVHVLKHLDTTELDKAQQTALAKAIDALEHPKPQKQLPMISRFNWSRLTKNLGLPEDQCLHPWFVVPIQEQKDWMKHVFTHPARAEQVINILMQIDTFKYISRPGQDGRPAKTYDQELAWTGRNITRTLQALGVSTLERETILRQWNARITGGPQLTETQIRDILDRVEVSDPIPMLGRQAWARLAENLGYPPTGKKENHGLLHPWFIIQPQQQPEWILKVQFDQKAAQNAINIFTSTGLTFRFIPRPTADGQEPATSESELLWTARTMNRALHAMGIGEKEREQILYQWAQSHPNNNLTTVQLRDILDRQSLSPQPTMIGRQSWTRLMENLGQEPSKVQSPWYFERPTITARHVWKAVWQTLDRERSKSQAQAELERRRQQGKKKKAKRKERDKDED